MSINEAKLQEHCPLRDSKVSFRLVNEHANGQPFSDLPYTLHDIQGQTYNGKTDTGGYAELENCYKGPVFLELGSTPQSISDPWYKELVSRKHFKLPITTIQIAAEQSPAAHRKPGDPHLPKERAKREDAVYYHVQVRDFVPATEAAHLPEYQIRAHFPSPFLAATFKDMFKRRGEAEKPGIPLEPGRHHVIEVKALRAYSPLLSLDTAFCALNNYHFAVMSAFAYAPFNQTRGWDEPAVLPPYRPGSIGIALHNQLARLEKTSLFGDAGPFHLLWEEVPYSKRLEVVPHDPVRYAREKAAGWDCPENVHYLNHETNTQAFITHNDKVMLITVRGTQETVDWLRDFDARQVPHEDGLGQAHRGFHEAFLSTKTFIDDYLKAFLTESQTIFVVGHSLGGAIALLVAEWLRRSHPNTLQLYTYGAPRAGDAAFVQHASELVHYRVVNNNDFIPAVPFTWMDSEWKTLVPAAVGWVATRGDPMMTSAVLASLVNLEGDPYQHHGEQWHFVPRKPGAGSESFVLWQPGCQSIEQSTCAQASTALLLEEDMPKRFIWQTEAFREHSSNTGYSRAALANLLRWHASASEREGRLFTAKETQQLTEQLLDIEAQLKAWVPSTFTEFYAYARRSNEPRLQGKSELELQAMFTDIRSRLLAQAQNEKEELKIARKRLQAQARQVITLKDVFGDLCEREDFPKLFSEWRQLTDVEATARLAKATLDSSQQLA